jgi:hypothetical protein
MKMGGWIAWARKLVKACLALVSMLSFSTIAFAQTNLVSNGSFEILGGVTMFAYWTNTGGLSGHVNEFGAEGKNFVEFYNAGSRIWQGVPTVPGRVYIVRFAHGQSPNGQAANLRVKWNGEVIGDAGFSSTFYQPWYYTNFLTTPATGNVSTLEFEGLLPASRLDDVSVGWAGELPSVQAQVPSRSVFEGGTVSFPVVATGSPPLTYQWYFKNQPVAEATNRVLVITNATQQTEGEYLVVITNAFGEVRSLPASLVVHPIPNVPQLIFQPKSLQMTVGYFAGFHVFAVGSPPLSYQWQFAGTNVAGATSAHFLIPIVDLTNAGTYTVVVSNQFGTTLSLPANLSVITGTGGGFVNWRNLTMGSSGIIDFPVFDLDGSTRLAGSNYSAQLYAGATSNSLHAVGSAVFFGTGDAAGYYFPGSARIPDVLANQTAYVRVRVWDNRFGDTFEAARALGGSFGQSELMPVVLTAVPAPPQPLNDLKSYRLQGGQPILATAKLYPGQNLPSGDREFLLVGEIGARYVIEHRTPPQTWLPLFVVSNATGTVSFVDTNAQNASTRFYRAQILEP